MRLPAFTYVVPGVGVGVDGQTFALKCPTSSFYVFLGRQRYTGMDILVCTPAPGSLIVRPGIHVTSDVITYHCCAAYTPPCVIT